jgi:protein gp37
MTSIEWTEETWNPTAGCSPESPGCRGCFAMRMAFWLARIGATRDRYAPTVRVVNGRPVWTGQLTAADDRTWEKPLRRQKPTIWFVDSMSDLFHPDMPKPWIDRAFTIMRQAPQHTFQILTKRPARMLDYVRQHGCPTHVWLGTSIEDQRRAELRMPLLIQVPTPVRFVSAEPLLEAVDLSPWLGSVRWLIAGAESGPNAQPMDLDWVRGLRDQCTAAGTLFFFKQDARAGKKIPTPELDGRRWIERPEVRR